MQIPPTDQWNMEANRGTRLRELATLFLRLGLTAFGGPAAHVAMMKDEMVVRRRWLTREEFVDLLGATNLIPGPNSTEMTIHVGHRRAGFAGLVVAGTCFILPAAILVGLIAWAYVRFGTLPQAEGVLDGVNVGSLALMAVVTAQLGEAAVVDVTTFLLAASSAVLLIRYRVNSAWLVLGGALVGVIAYAVLQGG